jgi:hypothetical protein
LDSSQNSRLVILNGASDDVRAGLLNVLFYFSGFLYPNTNSDSVFTHDI